MRTHRDGRLLVVFVAMAIVQVLAVSGRAEEFQLSADSTEIFGRAAVIVHLNGPLEPQPDVLCCFLDIQLALMGEPSDEYGVRRFDVVPWNGVDDLSALRTKMTSSYWEQVDGSYCLDITRALRTASQEQCSDIALIDLSPSSDSCQVTLLAGKASLRLQLQIVRTPCPDEGADSTERRATDREAPEPPTLFTVAPNPVAGAFHLHLPPDKAACPRLSLQLIDLKGRVVGRRDIRGTDLLGVWNLEELGKSIPSGVYLLRIKDCRNAVSTSKFTLLR